MNREELAKTISTKCNISYKDAVALVVAFESTIVDALAKGDKIVYSNFGTFYTVHYPSKIIYHPKLGADHKMVMLPTNAMKWMPSGSVKEAILKGKAPKNGTMHGSIKKKLGENISEKVSDFLFDRTEDDEIITNEPHPSSAQHEKTETPELKEKKKLDSKIKQSIQNDEEEIEIPIALMETRKRKLEEIAAINEELSIKPKENINGDDEEIVILIQNKKKVRIYEEKLKDGAKEETTFDGSIKLHEKTSFFGKLFGKKEKEDELDTEAASSADTKSKDAKGTETVSLIDSGIFEKPKAEDNLKNIEKIPPTTSDEKKIEDQEPKKQEEKDNEEQEITIKVENTKKQEEVFDFHNGYSENAGDFNQKESFNQPNKNIAYIDLAGKVIDKKILQKIPEKLARKYKLAPIEETEDEFTLGMVDPEDIEAKDMIHKYVRKPIVAKLASEDDINRILDQYNSFESELKEAIEIADSESFGSLEQKQALVESASDSAPASRIIASILRRAIRERASDIHIEPCENEVEVRFRIDGVLVKKVLLPKKLQSGAISRIKILSDMKIDEQRLPQDGRFSLKIDERKVDFRVSTMPIAYGEKVVMRILDKLTGILTIDQLGIRGKALEVLLDNLKKSHGMLLVTGPTGSGKTTTLYALISNLFNDGVNIVTLEDPIEYQVPGINQSQVNSEIDYTFASGLRSIVRQDPDIIMIGEIRDGETADMSIHAALTGHIVLSTLHTNNAAGAAPRLIDMNIEPFLLTSSLNMVIGQRLARQLCGNCKKKIDLPEAEMKEILAEIDRMPDESKKLIDKNNLHFFQNIGCDKCVNSGYKGRIGLYEILEINDKLKSLILKKESSSVIEEEAISNGMVTMLQDGILKAIDGVTTIEEVWRVTKE